MATIRRRTWTSPDGTQRKAWQARYVGPDRKRHSRQFRRKLDAQNWVDAQTAAKVRGDWTEPGAGNVTFGSWWETWDSGRVNLRPATKARDTAVARTMVQPTFRERRLASIQQTTVRAWVTELDAAGYAATTVRKAHQLLTAALEAAVEDGLLPRNPARGVKLPPVDNGEMRLLTVEEVANLADKMPRRYRVLVSAAAFTGLRWGELAGLRLKRLDILRRRLTVAETLTEVSGVLSFGEPKTKASRRRVTLPHFLCDELAAHLAAHPTSADGLVFRASEGGPLRRTNFRRRVWLPATESAGIPGFRFHDLRHTHATLLIAQGEHPKVVQSRLGHASIRTTLDTYGHLFDGLDADAAERLDSLVADSAWHMDGTRAAAS